MSGLAVVKLGGSLLADPERLRARLAALADGGPCLIVPGGGPFADAVRAAQAALGFDDALAHRLALDAMGRMAEVFSALEPRLRVTTGVTTGVTAAETADTPGAPPGPAARIWDPAALRAGDPDIPESWDVSSDSLALWLARAAGAATCLLVKSAAAPIGSGPADWARAGLVDRAFPAFAARFPGTIRIEGPGDGRRIAA